MQQLTGLHSILCEGEVQLLLMNCCVSLDCAMTRVHGGQIVPIPNRTKLDDTLSNRHVQKIIVKLV